MSFQAGHKLAHYEILEPIGKGGMGEVYRAKDGKLGRDVAIKVLPDEFAQDEERLRRFQREAKVLASLNHPNIAAIHGLEQSDATHYLVLELVPGETLAERIARGPIPVEEALEIATKIAEALEEAHERGIVHRDLKPANVKLTPDDKIKVLDFGLAKAFVEDELEGDSTTSMSPTITRDATRVGVILGTAAYMSPEQAKGKRVDKRADIWAFGVVLYEMLTGKRAFEGEDVSDTLAYVLSREPNWDALPPATPAALRQMLQLCVTKDVKRRVRDIGDVGLAMGGAFQMAGAPPLRVDEDKRTVWAPVVVALALSVITGIIAWSLKPEAPRPLVRSIANASSEPPHLDPPDVDVAITPDGTRIVYAADVDGRQLLVRALDNLEPQVLSGLGNVLRGVFISPDGNWVGYSSDALMKVTILGGPPVTITDGGRGAPRGASWGDDDVVVFATAGPSGLWRVPAGGGEPEELTTPDERGDHLWPEVLPGSEAVLFTIFRDRPGSENAQIAMLSLESGETKVLVPGGSNPRYAPTGHIVYGVDGTLRAVAFDLERLEVTSDPVPVLERVVTKWSGAANFSISRSGSLAYIAGAYEAGLQQRTLVWVDRQGNEEALAAEPRQYRYLRISPDGTRVALDVRDQENDIWIWNFERETLTRLTFDAAVDRFPAWTPDGAMVAFGSDRAGASNLYWKTADGTGTVERLADTAEDWDPFVFSLDGTSLLVRAIDPETAVDILTLAMDGDGTAEDLVVTEFFDLNPEISPDGRWLAYQSDESGQVEIYVRPFPNVDDGRWQVSRRGGTNPLWGPDGRELFYLSSGRLMAVPIQDGVNFTFGNPNVVFDASAYWGGVQNANQAQRFGRTYDISPDGKRFLMIKLASTSNDAPMPTELILVQNWFEELERLVPTN